MEWLTVLGHVFGAFFISIFLGLGMQWFAEWERRRNEKIAASEAAIALNIPISQIDEPENQEGLTAYAIQKSSPELLANRLSDFCGLIQYLAVVVWWILQTIIFVTAAYLGFTESADQAAFAWLVPVFSIVVWIVLIMLGYTCKIITGRYPGQAKMMRKFISEKIEQDSVNRSIYPMNSNN
jgi:hypothetical protein